MSGEQDRKQRWQVSEQHQVRCPAPDPALQEKVHTPGVRSSYREPNRQCCVRNNTDAPTCPMSLNSDTSECERSPLRSNTVQRKFNVHTCTSPLCLTSNVYAPLQKGELGGVFFGGELAQNSSLLIIFFSNQNAINGFLRCFPKNYMYFSKYLLIKNK